MALGYEGIAWLKVGTIEDVVLCSGASTPQNRVRLESSSGYGGQIKTPVDEIGIGLPRTYDWDIEDGSIDYDVTQDFVTNQIKPWIFDRQKAAQVRFKTRNNNAQLWEKCYWNNITFSTGEGQQLSGSLAFVALERTSYTMGGGYISNKKGELDGADTVLCDPPANTNVPWFLNPDNENIVPIPYWYTKLEPDSTAVDFVSWNLDFSQEVVKFFTCENNVNPVEPRFIAVGPMTVRLTADYMFVGSSPPWAVPDAVATLDVSLGGEVIHLAQLERSSSDDPVQSDNSLSVISVEYAAYELVA